MPTSTLGTRTYNLLLQEHAWRGGPVNTAHTYPMYGDGSLSEFELDCLDWGVVFGLAYGIARGEDPYESDSSVCKRALAGARDAYARWGGTGIFTSEAYEKDRRERLTQAGAVEAS